MKPTVSESGRARTISITPREDRQSGPGPADYFTGSVEMEYLFPAQAPARVTGFNVTFQPGARTAWHTHPLGQTLVVTAGQGWLQQEGGPVRELNPGDVVWIPPGVKHWHGATATTALSHIAIQEQMAGEAVAWLEQVSEQDYRPGRD
ncbi:MAG: cupin domain-containing protein [Deltaproteobacteria bacterium]|nr:cupin domain-containing protein [Deltaproteobacteria bacterium]